MKTLSDIGAAMRRLGISVEILYGSGGYNVVLRDILSHKAYSGYSWDIDEAFEIAAVKLQSDREEVYRQAVNSPEITKH